MTKKKLQELILNHKAIFGGIQIIDATIRHDFPHFAIAIWWKTYTPKTRIKIGRGKTNSEKALELKEKYTRWANEVFRTETQVSQIGSE